MSGNKKAYLAANDDDGKNVEQQALLQPSANSDTDDEFNSNNDVEVNLGKKYKLVIDEHFAGDNDEDINEFEYDDDILLLLNNHQKSVTMASEHNRVVTDSVWNDWKVFMDFAILKYFKKCLIPVFVLFIVGDIFLLIVYVSHLFAAMEYFETWMAFFLLLGFNLFGSCMGCVGVYAVSSITDSIHAMEKENAKFGDTNSALALNNLALQHVVGDIQLKVKQLSKNAADLNALAHQFDALRADLEGISDQHESIGEILDSLNGQYSDLKQTMRDSEKAHLLSIFYDIQFQTADAPGLDRQEYEYLTARLSKTTRDKFNKFGGFEYMDINNDGTIALPEFARQISVVMRTSGTPQMFA